MTEFRKIEGYDYSVSESGTIRNDKVDKIVNIYDHPDGYKIACLEKNSKQKMYFVHRLVAMAFIPNPENKPTVNHIDGDKTNNNVDNLEWATYSENVLHSYRILGRGNRNYPSEKTFESRRKPISCIETGVQYESITSAAKSVGVAHSTMSRHLLYKTEMKNGYHFVFARKEIT